MELLELQLKVTSRLTAWNGIVRQIAIRARRGLDVTDGRASPRYRPPGHGAGTFASATSLGVVRDFMSLS